MIERRSVSVEALVKVKRGEGFVEIREIEIPEIAANEVLIEVKACGICGSDIHIYHDQHPYWPPVVMGHEFSGIVAKVGQDVKDWSVGDRVVAEPHTKACGVCYLCRTGNIHICPEKRSIGWGIDGAFTKYLKMPSSLLHRIPDNVSYEEAALTEPTAVAVNSVLLNVKVEPGDFVVVEGPGPIGLLSAMVAKAAGASQVLITGVEQDVPVRLKTARDVGIDYAVNVEAEDLSKKVLTLTAGRGADLVVEASGAVSAINQAIEIVRRLGRVLALGVTGKRYVDVSWDEAIFKGVKVFFSFSTTYSSWERALSLISHKQIDVASLITHKVPLKKWESVFEALEKGAGIKGLLIP